MRNKHFAALICVLLSITTATAQINKTGKVTNQTDVSPMQGVSITVKGSSTGTSTDAEGNFSISVPDNNAVLVFSFTGFEPKEIPVASAPILNVTLNTTQGSLNEVVVIGYGTAKKS